MAFLAVLIADSIIKSANQGRAQSINLKTDIREKYCKSDNILYSLKDNLFEPKL